MGKIFKTILIITLLNLLGILLGNNYIFKEVYADFNGDGNKDFVYTKMYKNGTLRIKINMGNWVLRKNLNYQLWSLRPEEFDSVIIDDNSNIAFYYGRGFISYSNPSFIRPVKSVNRDVMIINVKWRSGGSNKEGSGIIVLYWDNKSSNLEKEEIVVEGDIKQTFYPRWTITYYKFLGWYSFLNNYEQPAIKICKEWDWNPPGFKTNAKKYLSNYLKTLKKLKTYLIKAKIHSNEEDIQKIKNDIKLVLDLIIDAFHQ